MAWTAPQTWTVGQIVTAANLNTDIRDDLRYLKGLDGTAQIQSGLEIIGTAAYIKIAGLTTAQRDALTVTAGMIIYNSQLKDMEAALPVGTPLYWVGLKDLNYKTIPGQAVGDLIYADTGTSFTRRAVGTGDEFLGVTAGVPTYKAIPGGVIKIGYGTYTGTVQMNRPIAHGMGVVPRQILATNFGAIRFYYMIGTHYRWFGLEPSVIDSEDVTTSDSTSFYLGTSAYSPNGNGTTFFWQAIG